MVTIKKLITFVMAAGLAQPLLAQTAKKFTVNITDDGELLCCLSQ